ncbi:YraN family protein [Granulicella sp. WH15]|uniref:YraN family protein n=1 Tax=Granulicella sp. WH15 TaxID=2602070 RepID=UPI001366B658|nr:YraN family protein [Granulicella sp. WH15]QHN02133.1 YraN family protein [Granulicella sp. WH15]
MMGNVWLNLERSALRGMEAFGKRFGPGRRQPEHLRAGRRGEMEALFFLRQQGYVIVARRWRCTEERGDLDLVGWDGETLCFVEVKTRSARALVPAEISVDRDKQRMLRAMGRAYLRRMSREERESVLTRIDVVSVYLPASGVECELLRGAVKTTA